MRNKRAFDEPHEGMESPCRCDCGKWTDLDDGWDSRRRPGKLICPECAEREEEEIEREEEISELQDEISDAEYTLRNSRKRLREILGSAILWPEDPNFQFYKNRLKISIHRK